MNKSSIDKQKLATIRKAFCKLTTKLAKMDLTTEELDEIRRRAKGIVASADVRKEFLKQKREYKIAYKPRVIRIREM